MTNDQFEKHVCEADINTKYQTNFTATIECGKCALKFETKELLDAHLVKVHTCNVCKKFYKTPLTLRNHYINTHKESPECGKCVKRFLTKYDLETHIETHHIRSLDREESLRSKPKKSQKVNK